MATGISSLPKQTRIWAEPAGSSPVIDDTTRLIACGCYSRGLWSVVSVWRKLSRIPYKAKSFEWGVDDTYVKHHLWRATLIGGAFAFLQICLLLIFFLASSQFAGFLFVLLVLLQWLLVPWFFARRIFNRGSNSAEPLPRPRPKPVRLVTNESGGSILDLGYLLREAVFSVDVTRPSEVLAPTRERPEIPSPEDFYHRIENSFSVGGNLWTQRVEVVGALEAQPVPSNVLSIFSPRLNETAASRANSQARLIVFAQHPRFDGLAAAELIIRSATPHLSIWLRLRWLPSLKRRFGRLRRLSLQRPWWRLGLVPVVLCALIFVQCYYFGLYLQEKWGQAGGEVSAFGAFDPETASRIEAELNRDSLYGDIFDKMTTLGEVSLVRHGPMAIAVLAAVVVAFYPLVYLLLIAGYRALLYVRGVVYAASGTYLPVQSSAGYRFGCSRFEFSDDESLQWAITYLKIIEQVMQNRIADVLAEHGIDSSSVKEEFRLFINEGIYMNGGELRASNVVVGRRAALFFSRRRRLAKRGQAAVMAASGRKT